MRKEFAQAITDLAAENDKIIFLTGDLGFMALEGVKAAMGERFINAGVAEQNMASMAASLAYEGFIPIIYSISPFITLRPYEQIRNDICLHHLPVKIIANGGGYGYGIMGATHHNIEDIGAMRLLPNMKVFVPFTGDDVAAALAAMINDPSPNYLRLNLASAQPGINAFSEWRKINTAKNKASAIVIATGTVADNLFKLPEPQRHQLDIWLLSKFPVTHIPEELLNNITAVKNVITLEEHQGQCGMHETLASLLLHQLNVPVQYHNLYADGYPSGQYGSQQWHLAENSLGGKNLENKIAEFISN
ncbi:MAG: hypothetical protein ABIU63_02225 [Chitinophagaceae bacterium]